MPEPLEEYRRLVAEVFELAGTVRRTSDELAAGYGQTAARWHVMSVISETPATVPAIARRLGQSRQNVQRVTNDLVAAGLVALEPNPDHERSPLVELTTPGQEVLAALFAASDRSRTQLLARAGVSERQLGQARRVLADIIAAFDDVETDGSD